LQTIFVANHLAIKFIDQFIHSGVKVGVGTFRKEFNAFEVNIAFGFLAPFFLLEIFQCQQHSDIHHLVKMPLDAIKLGCDIRAQGWGNFQMMTADRQVHKTS
jgi:hypothetical protein